MSGIKPPDEQKQAGGGHAWSGSSEAASKYLGARIPYSQYLIDYIIAYHEHASEKPAKWDAVLDLACGPGQLGIHLSSRFKHIYGRDVSQQMLDIAKALPRLDQEQLRKFSLIKPAPDRTFDYALGTGDDLNMPNNSVDMIVIGAAVHWFDWCSEESSRKIWKEWKRVLRPNGSLIATVAILSPGSNQGQEGEKTRPLRHMMHELPFDPQLGKYYNKVQRELVPVSYHGSLTMPWQVGCKDDWTQSSKLFAMFDLEEAISVGGYPAAKSDPIPQWMPRKVAKYVSTEISPGEAYSQIDERWKTTTPKKLASWLRSISAYVHYLKDNPDEKQLIDTDEDLAARLVKQMCSKTGLDYEETIEAHNPTGVIALKRSDE